jgi:hypothetical protein
VALGLGFAAWVTAGLTNESTNPSPNRDLTAGCTEMMQGIGDSSEAGRMMRATGPTRHGAHEASASGRRCD